MPKQDFLPTLLKNGKVEKLIIQLIRILNNWDENVNVLVTQHKKKPINLHTSHGEDLS